MRFCIFIFHYDGNMVISWLKVRLVKKKREIKEIKREAKKWF